ncbi:MAG: hypothetical protein PUB98_01580 [Clostridiales bacterium]|nr:hypothetical protein [Clostridiales bacterium]
MNRMLKKVTDIKQNREALALLGTTCFCTYYGIMGMLKAFGYVSYEPFYQLAFVLALAFLAVKVLTTRYTMREFLILYLLLAASVYYWIRVGEKNVLLITLTLWGMKNVDLRGLIRSTIGLRFFGTALMILLSCIGIFDIQKSVDTATDFSARTVYALGYEKTNTTFYAIFLLMVLFLYLHYERLNLWHFFATSAICYVAFRVTFCRTGMIVFFGMWGLILLDKIWRKKTYYKLFCFQAPFFWAASLIATIFYQRSNPLWFQLNRIFNGRIEITNNYYKAYGITLLAKPAQIFWDMGASTVDNMYMYLFVCCGALLGLGVVAVVTWAQWKLYRQRKTTEILFLTVFLVYAILEQSPFNPVLNPFLLVVGNLIYQNFRVGENEFGGKTEIAHPASA